MKKTTMNALIENISLRALLEQSLAQAAVANPHRETNPVRTVEEWCVYVERFAHCMPWQAMDIGEEASFFRRIDQNIGYFYFLLDQPLDALKDKGYIYPSLQYEPRVAAWLKDYNKAWGKWLSTSESWNDSYYKLARSDARFELDTDRYESPEHWHCWNDFFARGLRAELRNDVMTGLRKDGHSFLSPSDGEIAVAPVKTASIANWLDLLGDSPYRNAFVGGETMHIVLDVFDYHRFHAPCDGTILECKTIEGIHAGGGVIIWDESENRYRYDQLGVTDFQMLETRGVLVMDTADWGKISLVAVGVQQVSSVQWTIRTPSAITIRQGDELGYFKFGGSDIVLFFESGRAPHITPKTVKAGEPLIINSKPSIDVMTKEQIIEQTDAFLIHKLDFDPAQISPDAELRRDLGITSVDATAIASFVQKTFGCPIILPEIKALITLQDLYDYIEQHIS